MTKKNPIRLYHVLYVDCGRGDWNIAFQMYFEFCFSAFFFQILNNIRILHFGTNLFHILDNNKMSF